MREAPAGEVGIPGRHPVLEALRAGRPLQRVLVARDARGGPVGEILRLARARGVPVQRVDPGVLSRVAGTARHQGVVGLAAAWAYQPLETLLDRAAERGEPALLVALDGVQDPHNLGAVLRTADAAGAHGVIVSARRAAGLTAAVARASAGAIEHVPVARVVNLARSLEELKARGIWIVGAEPDADVTYDRADWSRPLCLVVGAEGRGIGRLVRRACDYRVAIPMAGGVNSLNAAAAAAVLLFECVRQRRILSEKVQLDFDSGATV